ncbi:MAG: NAD(+)/NADH kinase [Deltaproteobacteria bacterium]|nr:NAD(+)/NADH kinase [Deltaproteobacteria bacterium]
MALIGLVVKPGIPKALDLAAELILWSEEKNHGLLLESNTAKIVGRRVKSKQLSSCPPEQLALSADPIVTLGGDGTLIGIARYVEGRSPVMIGVNFGHLGFLTEISPDELFVVLESVLSNGVRYADRSMLSACVLREGKQVYSSQVVNDAVVQKGVKEKLLELDLEVNGEDVTRIRADGVIVSTPTGSTAYSLSAGGSIVHPTLEVSLVTPICAHSLTNRPLILGMDAEICVTIPQYEGQVFLIIDGQVSFELKVGDRLSVTRAQNRVRFVRSPAKSYFEILRTKLNWGVANKAEL